MAITRGTDIEDAKSGSSEDTANYFDALGGIWVSLTQGFATGVHGNDTFDGIENINGANFDHIITGDDEDN